MNHTTEFQRLGIDTKGKFTGFIKTVCPRCANQRKKSADPSLSVNLDEGLYKCHHCQWKGTVVEQKYNRPEKLGDVLDDQVYEFFKGRGISKVTVDHFKVTQSIEYMFDGKHHKCINFNYYDGDVVINIKYKTREKQFKMVSGAKKIPYNLNAIKESDTIIICEGEEETMCWHEAGYPFAVSCPNGAATGNNNLEWLDNSYNFFEGKKIYLATDGDAPGKKLREDLSRRFEPSDVYIIEFTDYKDANDYLKAKGVDSLKFLFDNAKPLPIPEISTVEDFMGELMDIYDNGYPVGDKIDYPEFDEHITWKRGQFVVVSGVPGSGKSTFVDQVCLRLALRRNWKFAMFSPENDNVLKSIRLAEQITGQALQTDMYRKMPKPMYERALMYIKDHFSFYDTANLNDFKIDNLLRIAKSLIRQKGIDAIVLDPFNYIEHDNQQDIMNEKIGRMLVKMKKFALTNKVMVLLVAHPKKMQKNKNTNQYEVPRLYDISGSHHFFNVTDNGFVVHRDFDTGLVDVYVQKIKHYFMGKLGYVTFDFDPLTGRYKEQSQEFENELNNYDQTDIFNKNTKLPDWPAL
jgi:twinkle protein